MADEDKDIILKIKADNTDLNKGTAQAANTADALAEKFEEAGKRTSQSFIGTNEEVKNTVVSIQNMRDELNRLSKVSPPTKEITQRILDLRLKIGEATGRVDEFGKRINSLGGARLAGQFVEVGGAIKAAFDAAPLLGFANSSRAAEAGQSALTTAVIANEVAQAGATLQELYNNRAMIAQKIAAYASAAATGALTAATNLATGALAAFSSMEAFATAGLNVLIGGLASLAVYQAYNLYNTKSITEQIRELNAEYEIENALLEFNSHDIDLNNQAKVKASQLDEELLAKQGKNAQTVFAQKQNTLELEQEALQEHVDNVNKEIALDELYLKAYADTLRRNSNLSDKDKNELIDNVKKYQASVDAKTEARNKDLKELDLYQRKVTGLNLDFLTALQGDAEKQIKFQTDILNFSSILPQRSAAAKVFQQGAEDFKDYQNTLEDIAFNKQQQLLVIQRNIQTKLLADEIANGQKDEKVLTDIRTKISDASTQITENEAKRREAITQRTIENAQRQVSNFNNFVDASSKQREEKTGDQYKKGVTDFETFSFEIQKIASDSEQAKLVNQIASLTNLRSNLKEQGLLTETEYKSLSAEIEKLTGQLNNNVADSQEKSFARIEALQVKHLQTMNDTTNIAATEVRSFYAKEYTDGAIQYQRYTQKIELLDLASKRHLLENTKKSIQDTIAQLSKVQKGTAGFPDAQQKIQNLKAQLAQVQSDINANAADVKKLQTDIKLQNIANVQQFVSIAFDATREILGYYESMYRRLNDLQLTRVEDAKIIADRGNAELLQKEQQRLDALNKKQANFVRAQQVLNIALAASNLVVAVAKAAAEGGGFLSIASVAAAVIAFVTGLAQAKSALQATQAGFKKGGYTGDGNTSQEAGKVHKKEFVFDAPTTAKNRPIFEAIHKGKLSLSKTFEDAENYQLLKQRADFGGMAKMVVVHNNVDNKELNRRLKKLDVLERIVDAIEGKPVANFSLSPEGVFKITENFTKKKQLRSKLAG